MFDKNLTDLLARKIYDYAMTLRQDPTKYRNFKEYLSFYVRSNDKVSIKTETRTVMGSFLKSMGLQASDRTLFSGNFNTNITNNTLAPLLLDMQTAAFITVQLIYELPTNLVNMDLRLRDKLNSLIFLLGLNNGVVPMINEGTDQAIAILHIEYTGIMRSDIDKTVYLINNELSKVLNPLFEQTVCALTVEQEEALKMHAKTLPDSTLGNMLLKRYTIANNCPTQSGGGRRRSRRGGRSRSLRRSRYGPGRSQRADQRKSRRAQRNR